MSFNSFLSSLKLIAWFLFITVGIGTAGFEVDGEDPELILTNTESNRIELSKMNVWNN